jgi:hypothetical protein
VECHDSNDSSSFFHQHLCLEFSAVLLPTLFMVLGSQFRVQSSEFSRFRVLPREGRTVGGGLRWSVEVDHRAGTAGSTVQMLVQLSSSLTKGGPRTREKAPHEP